MANTPFLASGNNSNQARYARLDTTATGASAIAVGAANERGPASWVLHVKGNAWTGSIVPKLRLTGSDLTNTDLQSCIYYTAGDEAAVAAGTGITANGIYTIPCDRCDLFLEYTHTSGTVDVYAQSGAF